MVTQLYDHFGRGYTPQEHRYREAIAEGRIPPKVTLAEFGAKYDDYGYTPYVFDPKHE